uniref:Uncharacterized protein n=1 Tax=Anguilla anguilla TaxID=7936 RepID=A0A0E9P546_ANGAN
MMKDRMWCCKNEKWQGVVEGSSSV